MPFDPAAAAADDVRAQRRLACSCPRRAAHSRDLGMMAMASRPRQCHHNHPRPRSTPGFAAPPPSHTATHRAGNGLACGVDGGGHWGASCPGGSRRTGGRFGRGVAGCGRDTAVRPQCHRLARCSACARPGLCRRWCAPTSGAAGVGGGSHGSASGRCHGRAVGGGCGGPRSHPCLIYHRWRAGYRVE